MADLRQALDYEDQQIRESDFTDANRVNVWLQWKGEALSDAPIGASLDPVGRVYIPAGAIANGKRSQLVGVSLTGQREDLKKVVSAEARYLDKRVAGYSLTLEKT